MNQNTIQIYKIFKGMLNNEFLSVDTIEEAKYLLCFFYLKIFILLNIWDLILITQIDLLNCSLQLKNQTIDTASGMLK
jgi:hypothetical protein